MNRLGTELTRACAVVLNISGTGLEPLSKSLKSLGKLKVIVAMNNEWTELDGDVVSGWKELNSLIVSHSPTYHHCPPPSAPSTNCPNSPSPTVPASPPITCPTSPRCPSSERYG
ncbi:hypothetical protein FIBSPDRAFT_308390 [Athelia psychrophila]|uniref:Uncharacterized protein n=1 Tax=Athelia psychrophila TaxID=1759441 RepID=A0A166W8Q3_9AGAM|nr:hypothetical protein FIBSPDRAFT_308390 [Fibularhizoctonia sp. CBS 109695]